MQVLERQSEYQGLSGEWMRIQTANQKEAKDEVVSRIVELMNRHGMTQKELAEELGITNAALSKWKNSAGKPYMKYMRQLCEILQVSDTYILEGEGGIDDCTPNGHLYSIKTERMIRMFETLSEEDQDFILTTMEGFCDIVSCRKMNEK